MIPVLTIDGPSGVGKGTVANIMAHELKWNLLDSGAIYRAFAFAASKRNIQIDNTDELLKLASNLDLKFESDPSNNKLSIYLDNIEVSAELRTEQTAELASKLAMIGPLRESLLVRQQKFKQTPGLVADGRDMGTVVFEDAPFKVFLTANVEERAQRRLKQLHAKGITGILSQTLDEVKKRDERDASRKHSPLKPSKDALVIDTSNLSINEVVAKVMALVKT
ncbi:MAG: (d)CMP kinase [Gammaproteobacteria bacterium]|jgi:cytidylate kinase|nr:(d)CMP kinase [Gammaproteobacteria bacterium]MBT4586615.1 (d)CMP kinase [Gammaproteobacteria bacterium]MBT4974871.1 (d)CMP kinase [Gammaproteobacteria bacterium]MBT7389915.1 (d)CMP kinase [Gammaproteobacteria bacterium]